MTTSDLPAWVRAVQEREIKVMSYRGARGEVVTLSLAERDAFVTLAEGVARLRDDIRTFVSTPHPTHIGPLFEAGRSMVYNEMLAELDKLLEDTV